MLIQSRYKKTAILPVNPNTALKNQLLAALPGVDFRRLQSKLETVSFRLGEVLYEPGDKIDYAYFPTTAIFSLLYIMENGSTAEIAMTGNDGVVGVALFMGGDATQSRVIVRSAGRAVRLNAAQMHAEFSRRGNFQSLLLRFTLALLTQIAQVSACNRLHSIEQRLCSWLLFSFDLAASHKLLMTHQLIADMLGVRREYITLATKKLQEKKLITNARGAVILIDRHKMEQSACECYRIVRDEYIQLLGKKIAGN